MRIVYLYDRHVKDAEGLDAEKVFADDKDTNRIERAAMIDGGGLREGDTLILRAVSDLGKPQQAKRLRGMIEAIGVTIEVVDLPKSAKKPTKVWLSASDDQRERLCVLWYSSLSPAHVLTRAEDIMGRKVSRQQLNRLCGPRDGSDKSK